jgi:hypothetical protein
MKIEALVARVAGRAKAAQALVICSADDEMPAGHDAVAVRVPRGLADRAAEDDLQQAMHKILRLAGERESRALVMPALGVWRDRARNDVSAAIIVRALLEDAPRLAPLLERATICVPISKQVFGFAMAQQLHDPGDQRPKTVDAAVQHLIDTLPGRALAELAAMAEKDLIRTHRGLALYLRNGLLHRNYALLDDTGDRQHDGASSIVVKALWRELKRKETGAAP